MQNKTLSSLTSPKNGRLLIQRQAIFFLTPLVLALSGQVLKGEPAVTIQLLTTFDYPGAVSTSPIKINDRGEVSGYYADSSGVTRGFVRARNGSFRPPLVEPNDTGNTTRGQGINNSRLVCGWYLEQDNFSFHSFLFSGNTFTNFDVAGAASTFLFDVNDVGDLAGSTADASLATFDGFIDVGGTITAFSVPGASVTEPLGINNSDTMVGFYVDSTQTDHGFLRDASGALTAPLDVPGSSLTLLTDIDDAGEIVGTYIDGAGQVHGFFMTSSGVIVSYDYPGAVETGLNGINNRGIICGRYTDSAGIPHGLIVRVR